MSKEEEKVGNVTNVKRSFFLSWCARVDEKLDVDEVEDVLENGEVMDLMEAEELVSKREGEARLRVRVLVPLPGDQGPDIADKEG